MVRSEIIPMKIEDLNTRLTNHTVFGSNDSILIASDFQRGDEETGVWDVKQQMKYIDSLRNDFPTGILTLVSDAERTRGSSVPWKLLDGGNRSRAIRDFMKDRLPKMLYSDLTPHEKAAFDMTTVIVQKITIEVTDPSGTIARMFCSLNTSAKPLSQGELYKPHGWKKDVWQIEFAKELIGDTWESSFEDERIPALKEKWSRIIGELGETKRCDNLASMIGYIISSKTKDLAHFDKRYSKNVEHLSSPGTIPSSEEISNIIGKFEAFLDILGEIGPCDVLGKAKKGIMSKKKIAPVWMHVCDNRTVPSREKLVRFYKKMNDDAFDQIKKRYLAILASGGNNEISVAKLEASLQYIAGADL